MKNIYILWMIISFICNYENLFSFQSVAGKIPGKDIEAPKVTWTINCKGNVSDGMVSDMPEDSLIRSNLFSIILLSDSSFNYELKCKDFIPGETKKTEWTLKVIDPLFNARAMISFSDGQGNETIIKISYEARLPFVKPREKLTYILHDINKEDSTEVVLYNPFDSGAIKINDIRFLYTFNGISLKPFDFQLPIELKPKDSIRFNVRFKAKFESLNGDSLCIVNDCGLIPLSRIELRAGFPEIQVFDVKFDYYDLYDTLETTILLDNDGINLLKIHSVDCSSPDIKIKGLTIDSLHPLEIYTNQWYRLPIIFIPTKFDSVPQKMIFRSNTRPGSDSICNIYFNPFCKFITSGCDWGKKKILSKSPYSHWSKPILIENRSKFPLKINRVTITSSNRGDAFIFDRDSLLKGFSIPGKGEIYFETLFNPVETGPHYLSFNFENDYGWKMNTTLSGFGLNPVLLSYFCDFGTTVVKNENEKIHRKIVVKNPIYGDTLITRMINVEDIIFEPEETTGLNGEFYFDQSWTIDKQKIPFPVQIYPGDSMRFDAWFLAQKPGLVYTRMKTVSDAVEEAFSLWVGFGVVNSSINSFLPNNNFEIQIVPNPMGADGGELRFSLDSDSFTRISLYTINGELAAVLLSQYMEKGEHRLPFSCDGLSSGAYLLRLDNKNLHLEKRVIVTK